jgi:hypothetical protein
MSVYRVGGNKSSQNVFPSVRPTLDLDFANSKTLDPRITFTRASGGSYVGADGLIKYAGVNEARFDHDPSTGESLGLLIEDARTNLLNKSEDFTSPWSYIGASSFISNILSPNGINYSTKLVESNLLEPHFLFSGASVTNGLQYTASIYAKAAERSWVNLSFQATGLSSSAWANFNLNTGEIGRFGSATIPSITKFPNGWYRCSITATAILTTSVGGFGVSPILSDINSRLPSYQGDGVSGVYIWGAQEEQKSFASSYIPTKGSTVTRAKENVELLGNNFSSWFNKNEGTIRISYRPLFNGIYQTPFATLFTISDGISSTNSLGFVGNNNSFQLYFAGGNILPNFTWLSPPTPSSQRKEVLSFSYTEDFIRAYTNRNTFFSTSPTYGSGKSIPDLFKTQVKPTSVNYIKMDLGGAEVFNSRFNCHIQNFRYYPKELGRDVVQDLSDRNR